jgi:hypothetical protein
VAAFDAAYATAPGELASMFAFAAGLEASADRAALEQAAPLYQRVAVTDPTWVAATAGLARALVGLDRPADAARVLVTVPSGHPLRAEALTLALRALNAAGIYDDPVVDAAIDHLRTVAASSGTPDARRSAEAELAVGLYSGALATRQRGDAGGPALAKVLGDRTGPGGAGAGPAEPPTVPELARATEQALLDLADVTSGRDRRHALLDAAARTRPWSLW